MSQKTIHDRVVARQDATLESVDGPSARPVFRNRTALTTAAAGALLASIAGGIWLFPGISSVLDWEATAQSTATPPKTLPKVAPKPPARPEPAAAAPVAPEQGVHPFQKQAQEAGLDSCSNVFPALGQVLTAGSQFTVQTSWDKTAANAHAVQSLVGMNYDLPSHKGAALGLVFAAPLAKGCEGTMVRIAPFTRACTEIAAGLPAGSTQAGNLSGAPVFNLANNGGQAMMMQAGNICIVVSVGRAAS